nr:PH domain-containing protein [Propionibacterium sp.]
MSAERPHPLTPLVQAWIWLVGAALSLGRQLLDAPQDLIALRLSELPPWTLGFLLVMATSLGLNLWRWWTTRFVVTDHELRVEHRGLQHESKRVAYTRIQSVDITQPFAARLLGMAQLTIDVGADSPIRLQYLSRSRAAALRDALLHRAHGRRPPADAAETSAWDDTGAADRVLLRVPPGELLLGAVLSHELLLLVAVTATPLVVGLVAGGELLLVAGGVIPLLLAIGGFLSKRVIGQYNYTLAETPAGLRISRGLASLSSGTVPVHRIQAIRIAEPVLWRRIGRARVDLAVLGLGGLTADEDQAGSSSIMLPIGRPADVRVALQAVWPNLALDAVPLTPAPTRARPLAPLTLRTIAHGWDAHVVVLRRGWWTRTTWIIPHARLQSALIEQGPLARRLDVAQVALLTGELVGRATTLMEAAEARAFVFAELRRARTARADELLGAP